MPNCQQPPTHTVVLYGEGLDQPPTSVLFPASTSPATMEAIFGSLPIWRYETPVDNEYRASGLYRHHEPWARARITSYAASLAVTVKHNREERGWQASCLKASMTQSLEDLESLLEILDDYIQVPWMYQVRAWERAAEFDFEGDGLPLNPYPDHETTIEYIMADIYREARRLVTSVTYAPELESEEDWE